MQKLLQRPTSSLPIPILSSSSSTIVTSSPKPPLFIHLPPTLTMSTKATTPASTGISFPNNSKHSSSYRYSYLRTSFSPTLTLTPHSTTKTLPWLLLNRSLSSNSSLHHSSSQQHHPTTEEEDSTTSSSSSTAFRLNRRQKLSSSSSSPSSNPDLLAIPGVGPRNFRKLLNKGIQGVAQLKQLYKDKVFLFLLSLSSVLGFFQILPLFTVYSVNNTV